MSPALRPVLGLLAVDALVLAGVAAIFPQFAGLESLRGVFDDTAILIILAVGQAAVLLTRCIDLSVAANVALSGMAAALLGSGHPEFGVLPCVIAAVIVGAVLGAANALLVWRLRMPSIVVTLGSMAVFRGLLYLVSGGQWVTSRAMSPAFLDFGRTPILGLTLLSWTAILVTLAAGLAARFTRRGRDLFAAGGNPGAAAYAGVDVGRTQALAFVISGALAGLCGYFWVSRFAVAYTDVAQGFELQVIAACVIGGVSIRGGSGTAAGVLLGALFLGLIKNALPLAGVSPFWQTAVSGVVIILAVSLNSRASRQAPRRILAGSAP